MIKIFVILIITIELTNQCQEGCLKCNQNKECEICDTLQGYILFGKECIKSDQENCQLSNLSGDCIICKEDFYIDLQTQKCIAVDKQKITENCDNYDNNQNCQSCKKEFGIKNEKCEKVSNVTSNCEIYNQNEECLLCESGYVLNIESECQQASQCLFHGEVFCEECKTGYVKNENLYLQEIFNFSSIAFKDNLINTINAYNKNLNQLQSFPTCQKVELENCLEFETFNSCKICAKNHFLNEQQKCEQYPTPVINYCIDYSSASVCKKCDQGYYLKNNSCIKVTTIENCEVYDGSKSISQCLECSLEYFLEDNICKLRSISKDQNIQHCKLKHYSLDICHTCDPGYVLSADSLKCREEIANCLDYHIFFENNEEALSCIKCKSGYYINQTSTCTQGKVDNCETLINQDQCEDCKENYYLTNDHQCTKHNNIEKCEIYSKQVQNHCIQCENGFFNFKILNHCKTLPQITNCESYNNIEPVSCSKCKEGYLLENNKCLKLDDPNCSKGNTQSTCQICKKGFAFFTNLCVEPFHFILSKCEQTSIELESGAENVETTKCNFCQQNAFPQLLQNLTVCVKTEYLGLFNVNSQKEDCNLYDSSGVCVKCGSGKYLESGLCVNECANEILRVNVITSGGKYYVNGNNLCTSQTLNGCEIKGYDLTNEATQICLKCKQGFQNLVTFDENSFSNIDLETTLPPFISSEAEITPKVSCNDSIASLGNCQYYFQISGDSGNFGCVRCRFGDVGIIDDVGGFIKSCISMRDLETNPCDQRSLKNIHPQWMKLFSCHGCSTPQQIPVLTIKLKGLDNLEVDKYIKYNLAGEAEWINGNQNHSIQCLRNTFESFYHPNNNQNLFTLSPNCGLAVINLASNDRQPSATHNPLFCAACLPKYAPLTKPSGNFLEIVYIESCNEILNCVGTDWFNSCSKCKLGYVYEYITSLTTISFTKCVQHNQDENCYSATESQNDNLSECKLCKKGYSMNKDNICEALKPSKCVSSEKFLLNNKFVFSLIRYLTYYGQFGYGCSECTTGYHSVQIASEIFECLESEYITKSFNQFDIETTNYIRNCRNYFQVENLLKCEQCIDGYIINEDQNKCVDGLSNCVMASNIAGNCEICKDSHALVNNQCVKGVTANCAEFNSATNNTKETCLSCKSGFYKTEDGQCKDGFIIGCGQYFFNNPRQCEQCQKGFGLINYHGLDYCFNILEDLDCEEAVFDSSDLYGGVFKCVKCKEPSQILSIKEEDISQKTICMALNVIESCKEYDQKTTLHNSTLQCKECETDFYYKQEMEKCEKRQNEYKLCKAKNFKVDDCGECELNAFLDVKNVCQVFPSGIIGCREYQSRNECIACQKNMYLEGNICIDVQVELYIDECLYYEDAVNCKICEGGFVLESNKCIETEAKDCLSYKSKTECGSCEENFGLVEEGNLVNCVKQSKQFCELIDTNEPFDCIKCKKDYYIVNGECKNVSQPITNCLENLEEFSCKVCASFTILSSDRQKCIIDKKYISHLESNCLKSVVKSQLYCTACQPGFVRSNGDCVACENNIFESGCFSCDLADQKKCLVCNTGFYQDEEGKCISYINEVIVVDDVNGIGNFVVFEFLVILSILFF